MHNYALQHFTGHRWLNYPSPAFRLLLLEEVHLTYMHVGGPKMYHLLKDKYWWPNMEKDCAAYC